MLTSRFLAQVAVPFFLALRANAVSETHTITFVNKCGFGYPKLMYNGQNILNGDTYTSNGPYSGIAYLQTGYCNTNGENCTLLETTLINPTCAGCGSGTDLSLIPPHAYSVETSFAYYNGCDGQGQTCSDPQCTSSAFFAPNDNFVQRECQVDNVNLLVAFCADASQLVNSTSGGTSPTSTLPAPSGIPSAPGSSVPPPTSTPETTTPSSTPSSTPGSSAPPPTNTPSGYDDSGCGDESETTSPLATLLYATGSSVPPLTSTPSSTPPPPPATPSGVSPSDPCDDLMPSSPPAPTAPTETPTQTPSNDPGCGDDPGQPTPSSQPTPPPTLTQPPPTTPPSSSPTVPRRSCRPRPTGLSISDSAPAYTPTLPSPFTPATSPPASTGSSDPCDDSNDTGMPLPSSSQPPVRRRHRHRRIGY